MKTLLDRLLARQQRLMDSLAADEPREASRRPLPLPSAQPSPQELEAEDLALTQALDALNAGDIAAASAALQPFGERASRVQTLTTLSRIASANGSFDEALALLERAERVDPGDRKVWRLLADVFAVQRRHFDEVRYRRKLAFVDPDATPDAYVELVRSLARAALAGSRPSVPEMRKAVDRLQGLAGARTEHKLRAAEAIFDLSQLRKESRALYVGALPPSAGERDVTARWRRMYDWCTDAGMLPTRLTSAGMPSFRPTIAELRDVCIVPRLQWVPIVDGGRTVFTDFATQRIRLRSEDPLSPILMNGAKEVELRLPKEWSVHEEPALLIGGAPQYYHHTVECLASLAVAEETGVGADLPLVVSYDLAPFQLEQLSQLGYGEDRLVRVHPDRPVRFSRLTVPSRLVRGGRWIDPLVAGWFRRRFVSGGSGAPRRRLYLVSQQMRRQVDNEAEVLALLARHGYETVNPEQLSVQEQTRVFAEATHVVGTLDAWLANLLFTPPGAAVVALVNKHQIDGGGDIYVDALAAACGHRFLPLRCVPSRLVSGQRVIDAPLRVDVSALADALDLVEVQPVTQPAFSEDRG